ncbi:MAG: hypothetical protein ACEPOZ_12850 [Marinifilaceae bacterium]
MKLFKPYVNLTKSKTTGEYTLNAVVNLPADSSVEAISQEETLVDDQKVWEVKLNINSNGSATEETKMEEFNIELKEGPLPDRRKVRMMVADSESTPENEGRTDVDYDDADDDQI